MTAIVGIETPRGGVVLGADSAMTSPNHSFTQLSTEKIWVSGEWIFGSCGSFRINQLLRYVMTIPQAPDEVDGIETLHEFMVNFFIDAVKNTLADAGMIENHREVESICDDSDFLVGVHGVLYLVQQDFSIVRSATGYSATGSGVDLALGALHATPTLGAKTRVTKALEAAAAHNSSVAPPFTVLEI